MAITAKPTDTAVQYPECVEHGVWVPIPVPPPPGALLLRLKDVDDGESKAIKKSGVMSFHLAGCTGDFAHHMPETAVAQAMAKQVVDPCCHGGQPTGDKQPSSAGTPPPASFFFHLGDIVYKDEDKTDPERADQQKLYNEHFYTPYANYPRNIFALAGNHDGKKSQHPEKSAIDHFLKNFCAAARTISPDNQTSGRATMMQPYPYWLLRTPLAYIVALYANDINGGQLDDPQGSDSPQYDWLVGTLKGIRKAADGRAIFLAIHYPPYSAATSFLQRGDPNLGPTPRPRPLRPLGMILQQAFRDSKQYPDAVFSAHAHHYQRITYAHADGRQIPYLIVGCGGHGPIESLVHDCEGNPGTPPALPADVILPPGLTLPAGDRAQLIAYNDRDFGFVRMTVDTNQKTLRGEFFAVPIDASGASCPPALSDSFTLDLKRHRLV